MLFLYVSVFKNVAGNRGAHHCWFCRVVFLTESNAQSKCHTWWQQPPRLVAPTATLAGTNRGGWY